jgi:4a-hydroxytetrahydrobiopterin dehydratase
MSEKPHVYETDEIEARLQELGLDGWYLEEGWLRRKYTTAGWQTTLLLVNAIGYLAEAAWHHPDLNVTWGKVFVKLKTHSAGGITDKDFALAQEIEKFVLWQPKPDSPLTGVPEGTNFVQGKK